MFSKSSIQTLKIFESIVNYGRVSDEQEKKDYTAKTKSIKNEIDSLQKQCAQTKRRYTVFLLLCIFFIIATAISCVLAYFADPPHFPETPAILKDFIKGFTSESISGLLYVLAFFLLLGFVVSLVKAVKGKKKRKQLCCEIEKCKKKQEDVSADYNKKRNEAQSLNIETAKNQLATLEKNGKDSFLKWSKGKSNDDLLHAAKCGHPYAVLLVIIDSIRDELSNISEDKGLCIANATKLANVNDLLYYCKFFDSTNNREIFKNLQIDIPYKKDLTVENYLDFVKVEYSVDFILHLIHLHRVNQRTWYWEQSGDILRAQGDLKRDINNYQLNLVKEIWFAAQRYSQTVVYLTSEDWARIGKRVNNPPKTEKVDDVIIVPLPDVTGM